jgi:hypothetical protein
LLGFSDSYLTLLAVICKDCKRVFEANIVLKYGWNLSTVAPGR